LTQRYRRALTLAEDARQRGAATAVAAYADTVRQLSRAAIDSNPRDPSAHMALGIALAYEGNGKAALAAGQRGLSLSLSRAEIFATEDQPYARLQLARVYLILDQPDNAVAELQRVAAVPWYHVTPAWIRTDPTWRPLRGNPGFENLIREP
jgi:tetratricopeptide (TPR) repeat protein